MHLAEPSLLDPSTALPSDPLGIVDQLSVSFCLQLCDFCFALSVEI